MIGENKMEQVAAMFGKKIGEDFIVHWEAVDGRDRYSKYHFSKLGIIKGKNQSSAGMLTALLVGDAEIVKQEE